MAINEAHRGERIEIYGACSGVIEINGKNLHLIGVHNAVIDGEGKDAVTVTGPAHVTFEKLIIQGGANGVNASAGAALTFIHAVVQKNAVNGILLSGSSSAVLSHVSTTGNGLNGLDAEGSSSVTVAGPYCSDGNAVFGININGASSLTLTGGQVSASQNVLGIQIGTNASAFIADPASSINADANFTTGLTIVSGGHLVDFGGKITTTGNGVHGVSIDSRAGLDLDAAGVLTSTGNAQDGVHLEENSVLTMFNTTAFSGAPGSTIIDTEGNKGSGIALETGSRFTMLHQVQLTDSNNSVDGVRADDGSAITLLNASFLGNAKDVLLTFGSRADVRQTKLQSWSCDSTSLARGGIVTCPK